MQLTAAIEVFSEKTVLVIGDIMLDGYWSGKVNRISPEAPVPIVALDTVTYYPGGAANVALNLRSLGATALLCGIVGNDQSGERLLHLLPKSGLSANLIFQSTDRKTTSKNRILAQNQHLLRMDEEDTHPLTEIEQTTLFEKISTAFSENEISVVVFQDYNKGGLTTDLIEWVLQKTTKNRIKTVVDPKNLHFFDYRGIDLFKPNLKEVRDNVPFEVELSKKSLCKAARYIAHRNQQSITLITLSDKGVFYAIHQGEKITESAIIPTRPRKIADVCGAGDSVVSVAALGLASGWSANEIAILSNLAGGQVCEFPGVVPVSLERLKAEILSNQIE